MEDTPTVPELSQELLAALDTIFPEASADLSWTDRQVWFKAGQRYVVKWLIEQHRRQQEASLENLIDVS